MIGMLDVTRTNNGDGFGQYGDGSDQAEKPKHFLDTPDNSRLCGRLMDWWTEARDGHTENRREQMRDADYYDCLQWLQDDAAVLLDRGQAPLTFPLIKQMADWIIGTERRTRIDWDVLPRKDADVQIASVKKDVLKWVSDVNGAGWERSRQFADVVKVGVGWTEECYNNDQYEEPITVRYQDWKGIWWDPYSRDNTLRDCRYLHRAKWLDLDYAIAMFPDREDELRAKAVDTLDPMLETLELEASLPQVFYSSPIPLRGGMASGTFGLMGSASITRHGRQRVLGVETWFKKAANTQYLLGDSEAGDLQGRNQFDPSNQAHLAALSTNVVSLVDSVSEQMWFALWTPGLLLRVGRSPYKHNKFPFTPSWAYRRHRDGMPYGPIRPARDSQDEYNKRRSKILYETNTRRVLYETGAMDEADENRNLDEIKRPDGEVRLAQGGLERIRVESGAEVTTFQIQMLEEARTNIYEASGVTKENTGTSTGDQSGRAILAKQQQGSVSTAELFDNFRQAIQESGQKTLSNCEQFLTIPKVIRITGPDGAAAWISINQPQFDPATGQVLWNNDITASQADFVVDETDYRETVRMAMAEMMFELIGRLPPTEAMALMDMAIDLTDLPNKTAMANRIRQMNGQPAPGQENSPEWQAQQAAKAQADQQAQATQQEQANANVQFTQSRTAANNAKADLDTSKAAHTNVVSKGEAMQTAGMAHAAPQLAGAADKLWQPNTALPMAPNNYIPPES